MNSRLHVRPAKGMKVQKLFSDVGRKENINENGEYVPNSLYYRRMIKRGELEIVEPPKTETKTKTKKV